MEAHGAADVAEEHGHPRAWFRQRVVVDHDYAAARSAREAVVGGERGAWQRLDPLALA